MLTQRLKTSLLILALSLASIAIRSPFQKARQASSRSMATQQTSRTVVKSVLAIEQEEGIGARVRRSIGTAALQNLSPFLMLDHFRVPRGAGFGDHPHRGFSTLTMMLKGMSRHEDSKGHAGELKTGGVQFMKAGRGIMHSEVPVHVEGEPDPEGMQLWIDLPKANKLDAPSYHELDAEEIPAAYPLGKHGGIEIKVLAGASPDQSTAAVEGPIHEVSGGGLVYLDVRFSESQVAYFQSMPVGWTAFVYVIAGSAEIGGVATQTYHTAVLSSAQDQTGITLLSKSADARLLVVAGKALNQTVYQHGPFVMCSREDVIQTIYDFQQGKNGFEGAAEWQSKIGSPVLSGNDGDVVGQSSGSDRATRQEIMGTHGTGTLGETLLEIRATRETLEQQQQYDQRSLRPESRSKIVDQIRVGRRDLPAQMTTETARFSSELAAKTRWTGSLLASMSSRDQHRICLHRLHICDIGKARLGSR
ncbi:uncharacterized protein L969DRAFT_51055 [Mixia osmundae IAM 14324]|uniref:Pirin N-terminal domain-containing protein n=1 Tax=Mixia osmundae (strain CBS 9802 / IAM 14324 / JCM 22182 / KY 12970) TaxID=764103 RepID=G7E809_MIXOS|nr:uncharacterized protein L969DRAFT_51055 [Mixia osmundae IAM 14324]KEI38568.1 hypothetical protein L969DRAFT_51055 [Mixia osmundae IAM 14324]GAA98969.1 hypothetical protein E5Q_05657 [Mixia osmundae IAM 14324]